MRRLRTHSLYKSKTSKLLSTAALNEPDVAQDTLYQSGFLETSPKFFRNSLHIRIDNGFP